jgi:hypothetical protein
MDSLLSSRERKENGKAEGERGIIRISRLYSAGESKPGKFTTATSQARPEVMTEIKAVEAI